MLGAGLPAQVVARRDTAVAGGCARGIGKRGRILNRAQNQHPHPRRRRGLSCNQAGEANNRWRGTRHPNPDPHLHPLPESTLTPGADALPSPATGRGLVGTQETPRERRQNLDQVTQCLSLETEQDLTPSPSPFWRGEQDITSTLTRAGGAASPATKRARRSGDCSEQMIRARQIAPPGPLPTGKRGANPGQQAYSI